MTTIQDMTKPPTGKNEIAVNGFKAPEDWYREVKDVAESRRSTIGGAILHLVELGLPIYEAMHAAEQDVKRQKTEEVIKGIKKRAS